jgi:hypothetical protein
VSNQGEQEKNIHFRLGLGSLVSWHNEPFSRSIEEGTRNGRARVASNLPRRLTEPFVPTLELPGRLTQPCGPTLQLRLQSRLRTSHGSQEDDKAHCSKERQQRCRGGASQQAPQGRE